MEHPSGYEKRDVNIKIIFVLTFIGVALIGVFVFTLDSYFIWYKEKQIHEMYLVPTDPRLKETRSKESQILHEYKMVDTTNKTYRIPIERAKELMLERKAAPAPPDGGTSK